jgi:IS5 family transposase
MFKILIFQRYYNLSDEQTEFQINDRLSVQRFLDISLSDDIPDYSKIWQFKNRLINENAIEKLFKIFDDFLVHKNVISKSGVMVDASFVEVPKQRNNREENAIIKKNAVPKDWGGNPHKLSHKDIDARWMIKNKEKHFGYKNHVKADVKSKIVRTYTVTSAEVHDSQILDKILTQDDRKKIIYADSAYVGPTVEEEIGIYEMQNRIHEKGYRDHPLTEKQKEKNKRKSRIRARVEHIFGFIENSMNGSEIKSIGIKRAQGMIGLMNLVYNMARYSQIQRNKTKYI